MKVNPADGSQAVVATLPSVAAGMDLIGGAHVALLDGELYVTVGQGIDDPTLDLPDLFGAVTRVEGLTELEGEPLPAPAGPPSS